MFAEKIKLIKGDITKLEVDVIVNAANNGLRGGGGVDGAIHKAAGPELLEECIQLNGCSTGHAKITKGYKLPAKYVIHTVGPVWRGGISNEDTELANCYKNSLDLACCNELKTIAFPNISTGIYGFPKKYAASIAITEVRKYLRKNPAINTIYFVTFDDENYDIYNTKLNNNEL